ADLPTGQSFGRPPRIPDGGVICLAVAQVHIPGQSGFDKRLRSLAPQLVQAITLLARLSPSFCDRGRLLDSTPVPCAASRETVRPPALAGVGGYGKLPLAQPLILGLPALSALLARGAAGRLRACARQRSRTACRDRAARARPAARQERGRRQRLR